MEPLNRKIVKDAAGHDQVVYPTRTQDFIMGKPGQPGCAQSRTTVEVRDIFNRAPGRNNVYVWNQNLPVDWQKVSGAMNCAICHDGDTRGALTSLTDFSQVKFKILVDQSMPNGSHKDPLAPGNQSGQVQDRLNANERIALANCLEAEFQVERGMQQEWLTEQACAAPAHNQGATGLNDACTIPNAPGNLPELPPLIAI
jgi:hypothetical protein